jgi:selenium metabolism protein YedF
MIWFLFIEKKRSFAMVFLYLNSDQMGKGDEKLGRKLLQSFLEKLADSEQQIDMIGCVNSGIHLTTKGSAVLESLKKLEKKGAKIASCGTCLDHFNKRDDLLIGQVGTMEQSVEIFTSADKIIQP